MQSKTRELVNWVNWMIEIRINQNRIETSAHPAHEGTRVNKSRGMTRHDSTTRWVGTTWDANSGPFSAFSSFHVFVCLVHVVGLRSLTIREAWSEWQVPPVCYHAMKSSDFPWVQRMILDDLTCQNAVKASFMGLGTAICYFSGRFEQ